MQLILAISLFCVISGALATRRSNSNHDDGEQLRNMHETRWRLLTNALKVDHLVERSSESEPRVATVQLRKQETKREQRWKKILKQAYKDWRVYKTKHGKTFDNKEAEFEHMMAFLTTKERVKAHNAAYARGEKSFRMEVNHLADLPDNKLHFINGFKRLPGDDNKYNGTTFLTPLNAQVPARMDWRDHGYVTPVKNQGMCGSCWSFSATGALEGQHKRKSGTLVSLSEQNLIDCSKAYGNNGCHGGLMDNAFQYIKENGGIDTERSYPYEGKDDQCRFSESKVGAEDAGFSDVEQGNEEQLKIAVATQGPVSVAIDAATPNRSFMQYKQGVYYEPECNPEGLDHGVLVVGYGTTDQGEDYWIVKNSWGDKWGEDGYVRMARNRGNNCGIASKASYPLV